MAALTADRYTPRRLANEFVFPVGPSRRIYAGAMVIVAQGFAENASSLASAGIDGHVVGVALAQANNQFGALGAKSVRVARGMYFFANGIYDEGAEEIVHILTVADLNGPAWVENEITVGNDASNRCRAGTLREITEFGVWVEI